MVAADTPLLIELILRTETPKVVCTDIKLCSSQEASGTAVALPQDFDVGNGSDACTICEFVVETVAGLVADEGTEAAFLQEVCKACAFLPPQNETACVNLIEEYGSEVIGIVIQYATPGFVCTKLGVC